MPTSFVCVYMFVCVCVCACVCVCVCVRVIKIALLWGLYPNLDFTKIGGFICRSRVTPYTTNLPLLATLHLAKSYRHIYNFIVP